MFKWISMKQCAIREIFRTSIGSILYPDRQGNKMKKCSVLEIIKMKQCSVLEIIKMKQCSVLEIIKMKQYSVLEIIKMKQQSVRGIIKSSSILKLILLVKEFKINF